MANLSQGESCTIPAGQANATVTNNSPTKDGSYDIVIDENSTKKQIPAGQTQSTPIHENETVITNSGKAELSVENCN
jgi:hypothetical protein